MLLWMPSLSPLSASVQITFELAASGVLSHPRDQELLGGRWAGRSPGYPPSIHSRTHSMGAAAQAPTRLGHWGGDRKWQGPEVNARAGAQQAVATRLGGVEDFVLNGGQVAASVAGRGRLNAKLGDKNGAKSEATGRCQARRNVRVGRKGWGQGQNGHVTHRVPCSIPQPHQKGL